MKTPIRTQSFKRIRRNTTALCGAFLTLGLLAYPLQAAKKDKLSDPEIEAAVKSDLKLDSSVSSDLIDIKTAGGIVILSGKVPNLLAKERATTIVEAVKGVRAVVNTLTVKPVVRTDEEVRKDVEAGLLTDPATDSYQVKTSVKDGVVTLTGTMQSWQEKWLTGTVVKGVKGVKDIKNNLTVYYKNERPNSEIATEIKAAIKRDVWVDARLIDVAVDDGKVTLTGTVGSAAEKTQAYADALTAGVKSVDVSGLKVEPWARDPMVKPSKVEIKSDAEIRDAVKDAFLFDPRVVSFNPVVSLDNGVVTLTGTVDNLRAKQAAERDAKNTAGVRRVKNYLKVRFETTLQDDQIIQSVKAALLRDPYVDRYQINVTALNGVVYLNGEVESSYEKTRAEEVASSVNGVTALKNNLKSNEAR